MIATRFQDLPEKIELATPPCPFSLRQIVIVGPGEEGTMRPLLGVVVDTRFFISDGWQVQVSLARGAQLVWLPALMVRSRE